MHFQPEGAVLSHFATLSGFSFDPIDSTLTWIIKNSYGITPQESENGFYLLKLEKMYHVYIAEGPVLINNVPLKDTCRDEDHDGYYFWGIGPKPEDCNCPDLEDCDDNNPLLGGYDENYNCTCLLVFNSHAQHISSDTTWNDTLFIDHNVIIDSGAILTIKSIIY